VPVSSERGNGGTRSVKVQFDHSALAIPPICAATTTKRPSARRSSDRPRRAAPGTSSLPAGQALPHLLGVRTWLHSHNLGPTIVAKPRNETCSAVNVTNDRTGSRRPRQCTCTACTSLAAMGRRRPAPGSFDPGETLVSPLAHRPAQAATPLVPPALLPWRKPRKHVMMGPGREWIDPFRATAVAGGGQTEPAGAPTSVLVDDIPR